MNSYILNRLILFCEKNKFTGYDPYDALNSSILKLLSFNNKYLSAGFTQLFRRLPINLRFLVRINKGNNPKALGLFLEGYSKLYFIEPKSEYLDKIEFLITKLEETISKGYSGNCWGYNFPWQSKVLYKPRWTPTVVNTVFVGHALLFCYQLTNNNKAYELAKTIPNFILKDLNRKKDGKTFCFSYTPIDNDYVNNANMLGASFLLRFGKLTNNTEYIREAHKSLQFSLKRQQHNGSWFFGITSFQNWIDSFHTGFKLESIRWFIDLGEGDKYIDNYNKGVAFYYNNFFLEDGTPKYYHNKIYPIDIHSPAEGIFFLSRFSEEKYKVIVIKISNWVISNMFNNKKGCFYFRKNKNNINKISYMRWSQAWMFRGLVECMYNNSKKK